VCLLALGACQKSDKQTDQNAIKPVAPSPPVKVDPEWITSEQFIQSDFGNSAYPLQIGKPYRIVGKVRNISVSDGGLPEVGFTAFGARLSKGAAEAAKDIDSGTYAALSCVYTKRDNQDSELVLKDCNDLQPIDTVSAEDYEKQYQDNAFKADQRYKDNYIVVFGKVSQQAKLIDGKDYIDLETDGGLGSVTAVVSPEARAMTADHGKVGDTAVMLCTAGYRYNEAGSIGLNNCKYLQNY
jgi:hypothetical protein